MKLKVSYQYPISMCYITCRVIKWHCHILDWVQEVLGLYFFFVIFFTRDSIVTAATALVYPYTKEGVESLRILL